MTNKRSTKRALLTSIMAMVLCVAMLAGTTFAWFTDSVTSANNIIKSGTLDVTMEWLDGKSDPTATDAAWKDASSGAIFNSQLWEPGYTEVRHIKIANVGTLALKYQLNIIANGEVSELADVIDVYYIDPAVNVTDRAQLNGDNKLGTLTQVLANLNSDESTAKGNLAAGENVTVTLALKMQETAGNEYQNKSIGSSFSIQLLATQYTAETDSFDENYDADAEMAVVDASADIINNNGVLGEEVVLRGTMPFGELTVTVPAGAKLSSAETDTLRLTVKNVAPYLRRELDESRYGAFAYGIYLEGIADQVNPYINPNTGSKNYNYEEITVSIPVGADRNDLVSYCNGTDMSMMTPYRNHLNYDMATGMLSFEAYYFTPATDADTTNFTFVYAKPNEAENKLNEQIAEIAATGGTIEVTSTADQSILLDNIVDALSGTSNIFLIGKGTDTTVVQAQSAVIEADYLTLQNMTIENTGTGLSITGDGTTLDNITSVSAMTDYPVKISGSNTTIQNSTFLGTGNNVLMINNNSDTVDSVTTIDGCVIETYYMVDEEGNKEYFPFGNKGGIRFQNYNGTLNITNTTINVAGTGLEAGPINGSMRGVLNVSDSTVNASIFHISTVKTATIKNVTFQNTWYDAEKMSINIGAGNTTFEACEFQTKVSVGRANYGNKTVPIAFNNCTFNGEVITAENLLDYFDFTGLLQYDKPVVTVNGTTVTLS